MPRAVGLDPDPAAVKLDDALDQRQTDAGVASIELTIPGRPVRLAPS